MPLERRRTTWKGFIRYRVVLIVGRWYSINRRNIEVVWGNGVRTESDAVCTTYELLVLQAIHLMVIISKVSFLKLCTLVSTANYVVIISVTQEETQPYIYTHPFSPKTPPTQAAT